MACFTISWAENTYLSFKLLVLIALLILSHLLETLLFWQYFVFVFFRPKETGKKLLVKCRLNWLQMFEKAWWCLHINLSFESYFLCNLKHDPPIRWTNQPISIRMFKCNNLGTWVDLCVCKKFCSCRSTSNVNWRSEVEYEIKLGKAIFT